MGGNTYLTDVQGLRTAAALLVAIYHIWFNRVSGGVDVFFVVAAYFMVASLLRREPLTFRHIGEYYASTARRVVPGAALVVAATAVACVFLLRETEWRAQIGHAFASLFFYENWRLIEQGADYLQRGMGVSPFQQMWALSLQMQIYLVFPLIYGLASLAGRRLGGVRPWGVTLFAVLCLLSFAYSVIATAHNQQAAYFNTLTRVWEFGAGALLALLIARIRLPRALAATAGWLGLAVLCLMGMVPGIGRQFPGYVALLPVLAAVAIIVAAHSGARNPVLSSRPLVAMGDLSFAFYLWHWPLLIFLRGALGTADVGWYGALVLIGAFALAFLSMRVIETPFRQWRLLEGRIFASIGAAAVVMALGYIAVLGWQAIYRAEMATAEARVEQLLATPDMVIPEGEVIPRPIYAREDFSRRCQQSVTGRAVRTCEFGDRDSKIHVMLVGGSHSTQWLPAIDALGVEYGFRVTLMTKAACIFTVRTNSPSCTRWNADVIKRLGEIKPDLVVTQGSRLGSRSGGRIEETILEGYLARWAELAEAGVEVLAIRENPRYRVDQPTCVVNNPPPWTACAYPFEQELGTVSPFEGVELPNVTFVDFTDLFCDREVCAPVSNGVMTHRDRHHLTRTFVLLHRDRLAAAILPLLGLGQATDAADAPAGLPTARD